MSEPRRFIGYDETPVEYAFNGQQKGPTHGFFAAHRICDGDVSWPRILIRDFGFGNCLDSYVGYIDHQWLANREDPKGRKLPSKLVFCKVFLDSLPNYWHYDENERHGMGNLKWYSTLQLMDEKTGYCEVFVCCTLHGEKFVWNLQQKHPDSCESGCHITGLWRD